MAKDDHRPGSEPFDVTLPEGFELGAHRSALEAAAKQVGWTIERDALTWSSLHRNRRRRGVALRASLR
jgi:hypothetical protein